MIAPFPPSRAADRDALTAAVRCTFHAFAVRVELWRAGFTRAERDAFMRAWDKADDELTLDEVVLLDRHFTRDWGVAS